MSSYTFEKHVERIENASKLSPCFDIKYVSARKALLGHIVHCADLSGQIFHLELALKWGERCVSEFRHQALKETQLGLPVTPFMEGLDDELRAMKLQQGFVSNIVLPLWKALAACFPKLSHLVMQGERNSEYYLERIQAHNLLTVHSQMIQCLNEKKMIIVLNSMSKLHHY